MIMKQITRVQRSKAHQKNVYYGLMILQTEKHTNSKHVWGSTFNRLSRLTYAQTFVASTNQFVHHDFKIFI